jgi:hypothetical protein
LSKAIPPDSAGKISSNLKRCQNRIINDSATLSGSRYFHALTGGFRWRCNPRLPPGKPLAWPGLWQHHFAINHSVGRHDRIMAGRMILKTHSLQAGENARRRKGEELNRL